MNFIELEHKIKQLQTNPHPPVLDDIAPVLLEWAKTMEYRVQKLEPQPSQQTSS